MTDARDPIRWKDANDAPRLWSAAIQADDDEGPDVATLDRMLRGVANELGRPELSPQLTAAEVAAAGWSLAPVLKLGLACVALALGIAGLVAYVGTQLREVERAPAKVAPATTAPAVEQASAPPPPAATSAPSANAAAPAAEPDPSPAERPPRARKTGRRPRATSATPAAAAASDPGAELALLERAQRRLAVDPRAAVAIAAQHEKHFPRGALAQEREMLAIDALLRLGERRAAERRARAFDRAFPQSSHRSRLADLLSSRR